MAAAGIAGKTPRSAQRHRRENTDEGYTYDQKPPKAQRIKKTPDLAARQRALYALDLRAQGLTLREIAPLAGYSSTGAVYNALDRELGRMVDHNAEKLRKLEAERLDKMLGVAFPKAMQGNLWALDRVLAIAQRRAKLFGLDVGNDEILAAMPYQKRIVLEDQPSVPAIGEIVE